MESNHETIADIVAEKRACADEIEKAEWLAVNQYRRELIRNIRAEADRIEAAWKREKSQSWHHREMEELVSRHEKELDDARMSSGNAAKLREAVIEIREAMMKDSGMGPTTELHTVIDRVTQEALAEPSRNCEVGTAEEQNRRFETFCNNHFSNPLECGCEDCPCRITSKYIRCVLVWAQMPYEEGGEK